MLRSIIHFCYEIHTHHFQNIIYAWAFVKLFVYIVNVAVEKVCQSKIEFRGRFQYIIIYDRCTANGEIFVKSQNF